MSDHPNIVFVLTDQWRGQAFGYAGDPNVKTPEIDALETRSLNFENAISVCPVCTPMRASLLTGRLPTSTGMYLNDLYLPKEELCMAEIFKAAGYETELQRQLAVNGDALPTSEEVNAKWGYTVNNGGEIPYCGEFLSQSPGPDTGRACSF